MVLDMVGKKQKIELAEFAFFEVFMHSQVVILIVFRFCFFPFNF